MLRYKTKTRPGLVALYDIRPGNGAGPFLQPRSPHGARVRETVQLLICEIPDYTAPALWPANNPELNPIDYQTWKQLTS